MAIKQIPFFLPGQATSIIMQELAGPGLEGQESSMEGVGEATMRCHNVTQSWLR